MAKGMSTLPPLWCRTSGPKRGGAPSTIIRLVRRADAPDEAGTRGAQPRYVLPQRTRGIRANPRPMRRFIKALDHNGEGSAL